MWRGARNIWSGLKSQTVCTLDETIIMFLSDRPLEQRVSSPCRSQFWPFLHCMDSHEESQDLDIAQQCADSCNMDWDSIDTCVTGDLGHK